MPVLAPPQIVAFAPSGADGNDRSVVATGRRGRNSHADSRRRCNTCCRRCGANTDAAGSSGTGSPGCSSATGNSTNSSTRSTRNSTSTTSNSTDGCRIAGRGNHVPATGRSRAAELRQRGIRQVAGIGRAGGDGHGLGAAQRGCGTVGIGDLGRTAAGHDIVTDGERHPSRTGQEASAAIDQDPPVNARENSRTARRGKSGARGESHGCNQTRRHNFPPHQPHLRKTHICAS